jgi:capsular polysaccharide biosynthesis protein
MAGLESQLAATKAVSDDLAAKVQKSKPTAENRAYWDAKQDLEHLVESHKTLFAKIEEQKLDAQIPKSALAQVTDPAEPGRAPVRPNKPLNLVLGAFAGIILATGAGAAFAFLSFFIGKRVRKTAAAA